MPCRQPPWYRSEIAFCIQGKILKECFFFPQYNTVILQIKEGDHDGDEPEQFTQNGNPDKNEQIAAIKRISYQGVRATHDERPALPFSGGTGKAPYVTQGPEAKTLPTGYEKEAAPPYHEITFPFPPKAKQHKKELVGHFLERLLGECPDWVEVAPTVNTSPSPLETKLMLMANMYSPRMRFSDYIIQDSITSGRSGKYISHNI